MNTPPSTSLLNEAAELDRKAQEVAGDLSTSPDDRFVARRYLETLHRYQRLEERHEKVLNLSVALTERIEQQRVQMHDLESQWSDKNALQKIVSTLVGPNEKRLLSRLQKQHEQTVAKWHARHTESLDMASNLALMNDVLERHRKAAQEKLLGSNSQTDHHAPLARDVQTTSSEASHSTVVPLHRPSQLKRPGIA
jgi:hypothetical protein